MTTPTHVGGATRRVRRSRTRYLFAVIASAALTAALVSPHAAAASAPASPPLIAPPGESTVFTLEPLNYNRNVATPGVMRGAMCRNPARCVQVPTEAALDPTHVKGDLTENGPISRGAATLDEYLNAASGPGMVLGFSQGGQIGAFWLNNYAAASPVDRDTRFVFVGSPANTYGVSWTPKIPTDSEFHITEVWHQYDGWADWPAKLRPLAVANAIAGMFVQHTRYPEYDADDPSIIAWDIGNVSYRMMPTDVLPLLHPVHALGLTTLARELSAFLQPFVEAAYERPSNQEQAAALTAEAAAAPSTPPPPASQPRHRERVAAADDMTTAGSTVTPAAAAQESDVVSSASDIRRDRDADSGVEGDSDVDTDVDSEPTAGRDTDADADADAGRDTDADADADADSDSDSRPGTGSDSGLSTGSDSGPTTDRAAGRDRDAVIRPSDRTSDRTTDRVSGTDRSKIKDRDSSRANASTRSGSDSKPRRESRATSR